MPEDSGSDSDEDAEMDEDEELEEDDHDVATPASMKKKFSKSKSKSSPKKPGLSSSDEDEQNAEEEEESWGRSKSAYYSSNAAELDSDDEEAHELEEQEAKRLQAKGREGMTDADFGLGDAVEEVNETEGIEYVRFPFIALFAPRDVERCCLARLCSDFLEPVPDVVTEPILLDKNAILRNVEKTNPETLALAYDWEDTAQKLVRSQQKLKK